MSKNYSKNFNDWSSEDLQEWVEKQTLQPPIKAALKDAIKRFKIDGEIILTGDNEDDIQEMLDVKLMHARQLMMKLKTCDAYNDSKTTGIEGHSNSKGKKTSNDTIDKKKMEEEIRRKIREEQEEEKRKEEEKNKIEEEIRRKIKEEQDEIRKQEEEKQRQKQQSQANTTKKVFDASKVNKNNVTSDEFYPTFLLQLGAQFTEKEKTISPCMLVSELKTFIRDRYLGNENNKLAQLDIYSGGKLLDDDNKPIKYYGIVSSRNVIMTQTKLRGGAQISSAEKLRKVDVHNVVLTITKLADSISTEDAEDEPRALMPCGHSFTAITMYTYILHCFSEDFLHSEFICPVANCGKLMDWSLVSMVADLTDEEFEKYSNIMAENQLKKGIIKVCPHCKTMIDKPKQINISRVHCQSCEGSDFCFSCLKKWKDSGLQICGNEDCQTWTINDNIINCRDITIAEWNNQVLPKMRACPKCLSIITYDNACKHMKCAVKECRHEFCFSCLEQWPCKNGVGNGAVCTHAPRQKL